METTSQQVLTTLSARLGQMHVREIREATGLSEDQVQTAVKTLIRRGFAKRLGRLGEGRVKATAEGLTFLRAGREITSGPKGPRLSHEDGSSLRSRVWRALRLLRKASISELLELAERGTEANAHLNTKDYLNALVRTGHVMRMTRRGQAEFPVTTGPTRYCICLDNGPQAPQWNKRKKRVFDPNIRETFDVD